MGAISALSTALGTLRRNTILFGAALVVALANVAFTGAAIVLPPSMAEVASLALSGLSLLLTPFFLGGLLAMAHEGLGGTARLDTFVAGGKANYLSILGAMVLVGVLFAALAVAVGVAVVVASALVVGLNTAGGSVAGSGGLGALVLVGLVGGLVLFVPMFFLQFYAPAIVVSDLGVGAAFERSAELVRRNLVSTLGYTAIAMLIGLVAGVTGLVVMIVGGAYEASEAMGPTLPEFGAGVLAVLAAVSVVATAIVAAFGTAYQVAFYEDRLGAQ